MVGVIMEAFKFIMELEFRHQYHKYSKYIWLPYEQVQTYLLFL